MICGVTRGLVKPERGLVVKLQLPQTDDQQPGTQVFFWAVRTTPFDWNQGLPPVNQRTKSLSAEVKSCSAPLTAGKLYPNVVFGSRAITPLGGFRKRLNSVSYRLRRNQTLE